MNKITNSLTVWWRVWWEKPGCKNPWHFLGKVRGEYATALKTAEGNWPYAEGKMKMVEIGKEEYHSGD